MAKDYEFKIDNSDFIKKSDKMVADLPAFIGYALNKLGLRLLARTRKLTPVDTGFLRRMWFLNKPIIKINESSIEIKNNTEYGLAIEAGHVTKSGGFIPGRKMLSRAMKELEPQIPSMLESELQNFVNRHGGGK